MANVTASELRVGNIIKYEGNLVKVTACHLHTPGNLRAMVQAPVSPAAGVQNRPKAPRKIVQSIQNKLGAKDSARAAPREA